MGLRICVAVIAIACAISYLTPIDAFLDDDVMGNSNVTKSENSRHKVEKLFIPAQPYRLQTGFCCATGPYNTTTTDTYMYRYSKTTVKSQKVWDHMRLLCPGILWPKKTTVKDCTVYRTEYYIDSKPMSEVRKRVIVREFACKGDKTKCCPNYTEYNGQCVGASECQTINWMRKAQRQPPIVCA